MQNKCVAFIDLLGFGQFVEAYDIDCIRGFFETIEQFISPSSFSYMDKNPFECFLISSDSIVVTAKKEDANKFLDAISEFFDKCFVFTQSTHFSKKNPFEIEMIHCSLNKAQNGYNEKKEKTYWLPPLFRCGISFGEIELPKMSSIDWVKKESSIEFGVPQISNRTNAYGKAVLEAIFLEREKSKGAKIFFNDAFFSLLDKKHTGRVITEIDSDGKSVRHYPWTVIYYHLIKKLSKNEENDDYLHWNTPEGTAFINKPKRMLDRLTRIYTYYKDKVNSDSSDIISAKATEQYLATIKMVMQSVQLETHRVWGGLYDNIADERIKATLQTYVKEKGLPIQI